MNQAKEQLKADKRIDIFFMDEQARIAFLQLCGYVVPENIEDCKGEASILKLARADAYMTTMLKCITLTGKGGSRNDKFEEIWSDVRDLASHEIFLHVSNSAEHVEDRYGTIFGTGHQFKEILMIISCTSLQSLLIFERKSVSGTLISKMHR